MANGSVNADSGWIMSFARGPQTVDGVQKANLKVKVTGSETLTP